MDLQLPVLGYGLAALSYAVLAILMLTTWRGRPNWGLLVAVALISALRSAGLALSVDAWDASRYELFLLECVFITAWLAYLGGALSGSTGPRILRAILYGGYGLLAAAVIIATALVVAEPVDWSSGAPGAMVIATITIASVVVLVLVEQVYRNARDTQRHSLKFLCLAIAGTFAYQLYLYSDAIIGGHIDAQLWDARGFVEAICVALIGVAVYRSPVSSIRLFMSRKIAMYTAVLFGAALYGAIIALAAYAVRIVGGDWGLAVQPVIFFAASVALLVVLFSDRARSRLRVLITKHFFENKYDYRGEWLRLIATLTASGDALPLKKRSIKALAQIVDSPSGFLWTQNEGEGNYHCVAGWNRSAPKVVIPADGPLVNFMTQSGWVIELAEYEANPEHYGPLEIPDMAFGTEDAAIVVPLLHDSKLYGFVVLTTVKHGVRLNFEDHDLLKTAGKQIASYLAQEQATEQLAENRQFEAFNRLTSYIMHDLKNLIAQQSLVVENAQKHKSNPAFIDDAVNTIRGGVVRMRRVLGQLSRGSRESRAQRVELSKLIMEAVSACADRQPVPNMLLCDEQVWVIADRDRLLMAVIHAIRNAQDATPVQGSVAVELVTGNGDCSISIVDTGRGMDEVFVRERLFKPFDSTKGSQAMGIGAYQIRETLRDVGGDVLVESVPSLGTRLVLRMRHAGPLSQSKM